MPVSVNVSHFLSISEAPSSGRWKDRLDSTALGAWTCRQVATLNGWLTKKKIKKKKVVNHRPIVFVWPACQRFVINEVPSVTCVYKLITCRMTMGHMFSSFITSAFQLRDVSSQSDDSDVCVSCLGRDYGRPTGWSNWHHDVVTPIDWLHRRPFQLAATCQLLVWRWGSTISLRKKLYCEQLPKEWPQQRGGLRSFFYSIPIFRI